MHEQEQYMKVLRKVIDATEEEEIKTSDELMKTLIGELKHIVTGNNTQLEVSSENPVY